ncbi:carboxymuconolactone decarboxylase family protein [Nocardia sp. NPDC058176]|uniref:carboxymuconolactone decarboxylase family protein n=1 Tax=Nocardia sp. NPDC058176 TaxID=3346368 RepID=UPI0036D9EFB0
MRPFVDKVMPEAWQAAAEFSAVIREAVLRRGLTAQEAELIKLRTSQINGCTYCMDLHAREARKAGITQQRLDLLPGWRDTELFDERQKAVLAVAEAAASLPLTEEADAELFGARTVLGDETFVAAEWVAIAINAFNRISILSRHPVRPRNAKGKVIR